MGLRSSFQVVIGACQGCGACLLTCPEHAIRPAAGGVGVLAARCTGCGECIEICPVDAISVRTAAASGELDDHIPRHTRHDGRRHDPTA